MWIKRESYVNFTVTYRLSEQKDNVWNILEMRLISTTSVVYIRFPDTSLYLNVQQFSAHTSSLLTRWP